MNPRASLACLRLFSYVAASLMLILAGCRSSAVVPTFAAASGYSSPRLAQRLDTAAVSAQEYFTAPQRRVEMEVRPRAADTVGDTLPKKKKPANQLGKSYPQATVGDTVSSSIRPVAPHALRQPSPPKLLSAKTLVHYSLHFLFPAVLALVFFPLMWQGAYLIMLATMLMDVDHLLAKPIFHPLRCSIGYHPLHSFYAVPVYVLLLLLPATQIVAVGLLFHLFTDTVDCLWSFRHCHECYLNSRIYALGNWVRKLLGREVVE